MKTNPGGLLLSGEWCVLKEGMYGKWVGTDTVEALMTPVRAKGWMKHATHFWIKNSKPKPISSQKNIDAVAGKLLAGTVEFYAGDVANPDWSFMIVLEKTGLRATLVFGERFVTSRIRDDVDEVVRSWSSCLAARGCHLGVAYFGPRAADYPRPIPPRDSLNWPLGALDYWLGRTWHKRRDEETKEFAKETAAVFAKIEKAKLPKGITRKSSGDTTHVAMAADPLDPKAVSAARAAGHRWMEPLIPAELHEDWNELGDRIVVPGEREKLEPFTFFDPDESRAYQGLILDPRTKKIADGAAWTKVAAIAKSGKHKGKKIAGVRLVLPIRADALRLHKAAIAAGFEMVVYPRGEVFWQVSPPKAD